MGGVPKGGRQVAGDRCCSLLVLPLDLFLGFVPGFLQVLFQFCFGVSAAVADGSRLCCRGIAVLPLPGVVIHTGSRNGLVVEGAAVFVHNRMVSQASMGRQCAV
jgi:hypothetical protein